MSKQTITLTIADQDISFEPTLVAYNSYINDLAMNDKVAPAHNYLRKIVSTEHKEALSDLLALPGAALQLTAKINEEFAPALDITVKN